MRGYEGLPHLNLDLGDSRRQAEAAGAAGSIAVYLCVKAQVFMQAGFLCGWLQQNHVRCFLNNFRHLRIDTQQGRSHPMEVCRSLLQSVNNLQRRMLLQVAVPAVVVAMVTFRSLSSIEIGTPAKVRCKLATHQGVLTMLPFSHP